MWVLENQIQSLKRELSEVKNTQVVFDYQPKNPTRNSIWVDTNGLKTWDGKNWNISLGGGGMETLAMDVPFSVVDYNTIMWGAGNINIGTSTATTTYAISMGSFDMTTITYFYWQVDVPGAIQTTTTASAVVLSGGILIAVGKPNADTTKNATLQVFGGQWGEVFISAANIAANSITANELSTNLLYAGVITLGSGGNIKSGQSAYDTGTGFWIGNAAGTPKLSIGNAAGNKLTWDGTTLAITGAITLTNTIAVGSITGLGTLATQNSVAYGDITGTKPPSNADVTLTAVNGGLSLTGGGLVLTSGGASLRGGQTAYNTGSGFWLGDVSGTTKFSIGNGSTSKLTWDGTTLTVLGNITATSATFSYLSPGSAASDINSYGTTINGAKITTGTVTATQISVSSLSSLSANIGTITAWSITGLTVTGGTIQTSTTVFTSGGIQLENTNGFRSMDSNGKVRIRIPSTGTSAGRIAFFTSTEVFGWEFYWLSVSGVPMINTDNGMQIGGKLIADGDVVLSALSGTTYCYGKLMIPVWSNLY